MSPRIKANLSRALSVQKKNFMRIWTAAHCATSPCVKFIYEAEWLRINFSWLHPGVCPLDCRGTKNLFFSLFIALAYVAASATPGLVRSSFELHLNFSIFPRLRRTHRLHCFGIHTSRVARRRKLTRAFCSRVRFEFLHSVSLFANRSEFFCCRLPRRSRAWEK